MGADEQGFKQGRYREGTTDFKIAIAVPGLGQHGLTQATLFIDGEKISESDSLEGAAKQATKYFANGFHQPRSPVQSQSR
jgi:hypothetical protein